MRRVEHGLDDLLSRVDGLLGALTQLGTAATYVLGLACDIYLISLNALVGACRPLDRIVGQLQRSTGELEQRAGGVASRREHLPPFVAPSVTTIRPAAAAVVPRF